MKHLHFDCFSGTSGDMILGALVDAGVSLQALRRGLGTVRGGGYRLREKRVERGGLAATKVDVQILAGAARPHSLSRIQSIIAKSGLPPWVKERGKAVFNRLAQAEGGAHRIRQSDVHFHEVGVIDSLVDVLGSLLGLHLLGVERVTASPVNLGSGMVETSHGLLPVPGPAVVELAKGLPVFSRGPSRELTTPTGLALVGTLAAGFGPVPPMRIERVGYGAGTGDPPDWPNVLRIFLGSSSGGTEVLGKTVVQIETNLDDMNPQFFEPVIERLLAAGAVDVTLTPVMMKKGRPGIILTVLAEPALAPQVADRVLAETTTLGVRMQEVSRWTLSRHEETVGVHGGSVRIKVGRTADGREKAAPEFADCVRLADRTGRPVREIYEAAVRAFRPTDGVQRGSRRRHGGS